MSCNTNLSLEQSTGQNAIAVAESPTSKMEEHGLISGGSTGSPESKLHGPHTITWTHTHTLCLEKNATTQGCNQVVLLSTHNVTQHLKITFLSRLDVTKNLPLGLQSHDQMIRLCMAVSFSVCAYSENRGSIWKREQRAREIIQTTAFKRWYECRHYMYCVTFHLHNNTFPTEDELVAKLCVMITAA